MATLAELLSAKNFDYDAARAEFIRQLDSGEYGADAEGNIPTGARREMLLREFDDNLTDYQKFVQSDAGGLGLPASQIAPNPDGTGNALLTFKPGDSGYDDLIAMGVGSPDASGNFTVASNQLPQQSSDGIGGLMSVLNPVSAMNNSIFGDEVGGHITELADPGSTIVRNVDLAANAGNFTDNPFGDEATGFDYLAGGNQADSAGSREIGRQFGTAAGLVGIGSALGAATAPTTTGTTLSLADTAALAQMGADAGLSGSALESFVASGGTAGSTAAGGGGVGLGSLLNPQPAPVVTQPAAAATTAPATNAAAADTLGLQQMGQAAGLSGPELEAFVASGGTAGSTAAGGGGVGFGAALNPTPVAPVTTQPAIPQPAAPVTAPAPLAPPTIAAPATNLAAADAAGLAQMGMDAGLSGPALDSFVASGGTMGSAAAGGGGVGLGAEYVGGSGGGGGGGQVDWTVDPNTGDISSIAAETPPPASAPATLAELGTGAAATGAGYTIDPNTGDVVLDGAGGVPATNYPMPNPGDPIPTNTGGSGGGGGGGIGSALGPLSSLLTPSVLSGLIQGVGGYLAADKTTDALRDIYNTQRADRAPSLAAYHTALNTPDTWYNSAPATGAVDATLRRLSVNGNPIGNPGDLAKAAAYNLGGYTNYLGTMGNLGLGGQATQAQLGTNMANSLGSGYEAIGAGARTAIGGTSPMDDYYRILAEQARRSGGVTTPV